MNPRSPGIIALLIAGGAILLLPGGPAIWFRQFHIGWLIAMSAIIYAAVYFGTLKLWELMTGDRLQKPIPAILGLFLAIRLTVDCARMMMWWW